MVRRPLFLLVGLQKPRAVLSSHSCTGLSTPNVSAHSLRPAILVSTLPSADGVLSVWCLLCSWPAPLTVARGFWKPYPLRVWA